MREFEKTDAAFISCYLDPRKGEPDYRGFLKQRTDSLRRNLSGTASTDFAQALEMIESRLEGDFYPEARGLAVFARAQGGGRFFSDMQFAVPVENSLAVYPAPLIHPLLALKDTYDRYALVFVRREAVQVIEVNLGAASTRGWVANPKSIRGDGSWISRPGEENPEAASFVRLDGQVPMVERLLQTGDRTRLFLAGDPELVAAMRAALRAPWAARLVDVLPMAAKGTLEDAVSRSLRTFVDLRNRESSRLATGVAQGVSDSGLAVSGDLASLEALREGRADMLVICEDYRPEPGWACDRCGESRMQERPPGNCTACGRSGARTLDPRAEMVRLAGQQDVEVRFTDSDELSHLGGVGCLLHYRDERMMVPASQAYSRLALVA